MNRYRQGKLDYICVIVFGGLIFFFNITNFSFNYVKLVKVDLLLVFFFKIDILCI